MRNLQRTRNLFFVALTGCVLLPGATTVSAGESPLTTSHRVTPAASWGEEFSAITSKPEKASSTEVWVQATPAQSSMAAATTSADRGRAHDFVPLLAREQSRSLAATRGITDSETAGLFDPESSANPAVVPLPASVWAGLAVLLTTVWLGRHSKRRLRLPI